MKKKVLSIALACMLALALALVGCSGTPAGGASGNEGATETPVAQATGLTLTDMTGREVVLAGPATRIVVLTAGDAEILYAIGAGSMVVGRGEYCNYPAQVLEVTAVQSGSDTNVEQIIALHPDLVIMSTMGQSPEQVSQLSAVGIPVISTDAQSIEETYACITLLGQATGKEAQATKVIEDMKKVFTDLSARAKSVAGAEKSIYFEVSPLEYGLWAAGDDTFMNEVAELLGLVNIFADIEGWAEVSEEQVIERNPDYIMTVGMYFGEGPTPVESILARPGWDKLTAVQNLAILNISTDELSRPGPRLAEGAQMLFKFVYGE